MDFVVEEDLKAHLTCWYIQKYVKENPQPQYLEHISQWANMALRGRRECVAAHVGVAAQQKELPGIVELCLKWTPGMTHPTAETSVRRVLGQQVSQVCTLWRKRTQKMCFSASPWVDLTKAAAFYLRQKPPRCIFSHWLEVKAAMKADVSQVSCFSLDTAVASSSRGRPTQASVSIAVHLWWLFFLLFFNGCNLLIFTDFVF